MEPHKGMYTHDPGFSIYAATKRAINTLTGNDAKKYGKDGIRINAVLPGGMMTEAMQEFKDQVCWYYVFYVHPSTGRRPLIMAHYL